MKNKKLLAIFIIIILLALFLRVYKLNLKPMHHDEGTHWYFFINKIYHGISPDYLPDFHGFTSWYLGSIPLFLFGLSIFSLRLMTAIIGAASIALLYPLKKYMGNFGLIVSASFIAVSPSLTYYSRHLSQYPYILFFLILTIVLFIKFLENHKEIFLYFSSISLGLLIATHELALILILLAFLFPVLIYFTNFPDKKIKNKIKNIIHKINNKDVIISFTLLGFTIILIMSSFFTNFNSLADFLNQSTFQLEKSFNTGHNKPFYYYFIAFLPLELFAFFGSIISIFLFKKNDLFYLFIVYFTFSCFIILSLIPYKIPWIFILVLFQMYVLTGLNINILLKNNKKISILIIIFLLISIALTILFNYISPINNTLNYIGPTNDFQNLTSDLQNYLSKNSKVLITSESYWPLPYYLKDYEILYLNNYEIINPDDYPEYSIFIINNNQINDNNNFVYKKYELRKNYFITIAYKITQ